CSSDTATSAFSAAERGQHAEHEPLERAALRIVRRTRFLVRWRFVAFGGRRGGLALAQRVLGFTAMDRTVRITHCGGPVGETASANAARRPPCKAAMLGVRRLSSTMRPRSSVTTLSAVAAVCGR